MFIVWGEGTYSKRNVRKVNGECESCHFVGPLSHYDGTRFFTLYWLPIIPMGSKRIFDECPKCGNGRAMSTRQWQKLVTDELNPAIEQFVAAPTDRAAAERSLQAAVVLADTDRFTEVALAIEQHYGGDASMLRRLAGHYNHFFMQEEAESAFRAVLSLEDTTDTRQALAVFLIDSHRPAEADEHVHAVLASGDDQRAMLGLMLAESYLQLGDVDNARRALDATATSCPDIAATPEYARLSKALDSPKMQKKMRINRPAVAANAPAAPTASPTNANEPGLIRKSWPFVVPVVLLTLIAALVIAVLQPTQPTIYAINGTEAHYHVIVNGEKVRLRAQHPKELRIEGDTIRIEPTDDSPSFPVIETTAEPGHDALMVINPDRLAALLWERAEYADTQQLDDLEYEQRLHTGQTVYAFDDIDFKMKDLPDEITLDSSRSRAFKQGVTYLNEWPPVSVVQWLLESEGDEQRARQYVVHALAVMPDELALLNMAGQVLDQAAFDAMAKPHLEKRPLRIQWHRMRQVVHASHTPSETLVDEYLAMWEDESARTSGLAYLIARIHDDPAEAQRWFDVACNFDPPEAIALYGSAYGLLSRGRFSDAQQRLERALTLDPELWGAAFLREQVLMAQRDYPALIKEFEAQRAEAPANGNATEALVMLYELNGQPAKATAEIARATDYHRTEFGSDEQEVEWYTHYLEMIRAMANRDRDAVIQRCRKLDSPGWAATLLMHEGKLAEAAQHLDDNPDADTPEQRMLLAALAYKAGDQKLAGASVKAAADTLGAGDHDGYMLAQLLTADEAPALDQAVHFALRPDRVRVVTALLAARHPDHAEPFRQRARAMNFDPRGPAMLIADIVGD